MTKLQVPCVVCKTPIYIADNVSRKTAVCTSCKRQGKAPKRKSIERCSQCKIKLTDGLVSLRSGLCLFCYAKMIEVELKRAETELDEKRRAIMAISSKSDDMEITDTAVFGGHPWSHANTNPVT